MFYARVDLCCNSSKCRCGNFLSAWECHTEPQNARLLLPFSQSC
jgi:hypothetical protein